MINHSLKGRNSYYQSGVLNSYIKVLADFISGKDSYRLFLWYLFLIVNLVQLDKSTSEMRDGLYHFGLWGCLCQETQPSMGVTIPYIGLNCLGVKNQSKHKQASSKHGFIYRHSCLWMYPSSCHCELPSFQIWWTTVLNIKMN